MLTVMVLTACTAGAPTGATLPPLTTSSVTTTDVATTAESTAQTPTSETPTSESVESTPVETSTPVEATVPPEASALPLPTEQIDIPADSPQEEADRAAIEAVWRQVWDLYTRIDTFPEAERRPAVDAVAVGDIADQLMDVGRISNQNGVVSYGSIVLHPYWYHPVAGADLAVIGDCRDTSSFGDKKIDTGEVTTVGVAGSNTVGQFVRQNGQWKLWAISYMSADDCAIS